jgi:glycosyltransferase involved in cell wall biosynthesis
MKDNSNPLVSVGIPTYNRVEALNSSIDCFTNQTYKNIEIIISDNCSPDPMYYEIAKKNIQGVKFFRQDKNIGFKKNHDFVKQKANGKYFMWAHDDDVFPPDYIEVSVRHLEADPGAVLVGPRCDRYLNGKYWYTYDDFSSIGLSTYERLKQLIPDGFISHDRFEQYFNGVFLLSAAPLRLSEDFKEQFYLFFALSEKGTILNAPELHCIKHTTQEQLDRYNFERNFNARTSDRHHSLLRFFSRNMKECLPITLQMMDIIIRSKNLIIPEKSRLLAMCFYLFCKYTLLAEIKSGIRLIKKKFIRSEMH